MLRGLFGKIQSFRSGFPVKTGDGCYRVRMVKPFFFQKDKRYKIDARAIVLAIVAEEIGNDDPEVIRREIARRRLIEYVRRICDEQEIWRVIKRVEEASLHQSGHTVADVIPFAEAKARAEARRAHSVSSHRQPVSNVFSDNKTEKTAMTVTKPEPIAAAIEVPTPTEERIDAELVRVAIEEALSVARDDTERELFREYLEAHPELSRDILDKDTTVSLWIDSEGRVRAARKHCNRKARNA